VRAPRLRAAVLAFALAAAAGCGGDRAAEAPHDATPGGSPVGVPEGAVARRCTRVVDGDTVILDGGERLRLIGVDTPELHRPGTPVQYFARSAKAFTRGLVERRRVRLAYDQTRRDRYGRTLGYLFLDDGTFVNLEIVKQGYGFAYTRFPFRYMSEFRAAERSARERRAGLWAHPDSIRVPVGPPA